MQHKIQGNLGVGFIPFSRDLIFCNIDEPYSEGEGVIASISEYGKDFSENADVAIVPIRKALGIFR